MTMTAKNFHHFMKLLILILLEKFEKNTAGLASAVKILLEPNFFQKVTL